MIRKLAVIKQRLMSDFVPKEFPMKKTYFGNIASETKQFLTENYRGSTSISISEIREARVEFSAVGYAYILKLVLNSIYGTCVAEIDISEKEDGLSVVMSRKRGSFKEDELEEIQRVAEISGIKLHSGTKSIELIFERSNDKRIIFRQTPFNSDLLFSFIYVFFTPTLTLEEMIEIEKKNMEDKNNKI